MKQVDPINHTKRKDKRPPRIPIQLSLAESDALDMIAEAEQRSKAAMARIIYQLGMSQYQELRKRKRRP